MVAMDGTLSLSLHFAVCVAACLCVALHGAVANAGRRLGTAQAMVIPDRLNAERQLLRQARQIFPRHESRERRG